MNVINVHGEKVKINTGLLRKCHLTKLPISKTIQSVSWVVKIAVGMIT